MDESTKPTTNALDDLCPCILDQISKSIARKKRDAELDHMLKLVEQCKPNMKFEPGWGLFGKHSPYTRLVMKRHKRKQRIKQAIIVSGLSLSIALFMIHRTDN